MVWFLVDDNLASHRKADQAGNAALGLWVRCGAWSAGNLTDGHIPRRIALRFGTQSQCDSLCRAGMWVTRDNEYVMHDWPDFQPTAEQVKQRREDARKRKAKHRENQNVTRDGTRDGTRDLARAGKTPTGFSVVGDGTRDRHHPATTAAPPAPTARRRSNDDSLPTFEEMADQETEDRTPFIQAAENHRAQIKAALTKKPQPL